MNCYNMVFKFPTIKHDFRTDKTFASNADAPIPTFAVAAFQSHMENHGIFKTRTFKCKYKSRWFNNKLSPCLINISKIIFDVQTSVPKYVARTNDDIVSLLKVYRHLISTNTPKVISNKAININLVFNFVLRCRDISACRTLEIF